MDLNSPLANELRLNEYQKRGLNKLGLKTIKDLLWHFPARYEQTSEHKTVADVTAGEKATLAGKISNLKFEKTRKRKMNIARAILNDGTGKIKLIWFHQPYIARMLKNEDEITATGKIQENKKGFYIANPTYSQTTYDVGLKTDIVSRLSAVYPETRGLSSQWFHFNIRKILDKMPKTELIDIIPEEILKKYHLPSLKNALIYIHMPKNEKDAEAARKRFAFEEIFLIQLSRIKSKLQYKKQKAFLIKTEKTLLENFIKNFQFKLTGAQTRATERILNDLQKKSPMARFLEGDVGSGKTAVAAISAFSVLQNGYQTAYMAPTEVLARQLFDSFTKHFINTGAKIGLLTSSEGKKFPSKVNPSEATHISKSRLLKWVEGGEIPILIGTHALIQNRVKFKNIALAIIDEQHRFGTNQRAMLVKKSGVSPHFLSMSATPIPRTLALTIYGDLDLSLIDEMPPGRKEVITEIVPPTNRHTAYQKIREEINKGRQSYVICPRIEPSEENSKNILLLNMKAVKEEYKKLSEEIFPEHKIGMLHGKMSAKEKEKTMKEFERGKINLLVATSVVEVGVNVPNATVIIIEGAERFGLAQLHQLRGRVLRSTHQPYCFIFTESKSKNTINRLNALKRAKNGFELAEYDLQFRGPGELSGKKQWGISDVGMEALKNLKMVEAAREEAQNLLNEDPELKNYPLLQKRVQKENFNIHFE